MPMEPAFGELGISYGFLKKEFKFTVVILQFPTLLQKQLIYVTRTKAPKILYKLKYIMLNTSFYNN